MGIVVVGRRVRKVVVIVGLACSLGWNCLFVVFFLVTFIPRFAVSHSRVFRTFFGCGSTFLFNQGVFHV